MTESVVVLLSSVSTLVFSGCGAARYLPDSSQGRAAVRGRQLFSDRILL